MVGDLITMAAPQRTYYKFKTVDVLECEGDYCDLYFKFAKCCNLGPPTTSGGLKPKIIYGIASFY